MAKKAKKDKDVKKLERLNRSLKKQEQDIASELGTYNEMINDFRRNIALFKFICHSSVIGQDEKYRSLPNEEHKEKYARIAELKQLDVAITSLTDDHLNKVVNIFSLMKKVKKNIPQVIGVMGEQLLPAITDLQVATINVMDMVKQCIPKNQDVLEKMAEQNPQFKQLLTAFNQLNENLAPKKELDEVVAPLTDLEFTTEEVEPEYPQLN